MPPSRPVLQIIKAPNYSDGDPSHRPDADSRVLIDLEPILEKIAFKWMQDNLDDVEPGKFVDDGYRDSFCDLRIF